MQNLTDKRRTGDKRIFSCLKLFKDFGWSHNLTQTISVWICFILYLQIKLKVNPCTFLHVEIYRYCNNICANRVGSFTVQALEVTNYFLFAEFYWSSVILPVKIQTRLLAQLFDFFVNNQQHKIYISVITYLVYLKWQLSKKNLKKETPKHNYILQN